MPTQEIRFFGDPVLVTPAALVIDFDKEIRTLISDLTQTMLAAPGAGLAAPQIGVPLRAFVWHVNDELGHLINPTLVLSGEIDIDDEGCLSFPELTFPTPRSIRAVARGFNMYGQPIEVDGSELLARALQHETDHLDGILFIDRLSKVDRKLAMKEIRETDWFNSAIARGVPVSIKESPHPIFGRRS